MMLLLCSHVHYVHKQAVFPQTPGTLSLPPSGVPMGTLPLYMDSYY